MSDIEIDADVEALVEQAARRIAAGAVWLNAREAAGRARLSTDNFLKRVRSGRGPAYSGEGRLMRFQAADVDCWVHGGFSHAA